jgi:acetylornithine deacetylase/succinyl-diaminopimelate desuccinylase-like protein
MNATQKTGREAAIAAALAPYRSGALRETLARRVAIPSESQNPERSAALTAYLVDEMRPDFAAMGFETEIVDNPRGAWPLLIASRIEDEAAPTILGYGHGDVIRGMDGRWAEGLSPWRLVDRDGRWHGRGVADNKGQHLINMTALKAVLDTRGRLGFNAKYIIETGEEMGSPGLREVCAARRETLKADLLIASDGPRLSAARPTIFLGARGGFTFDLAIEAREGAHHSGNWGGLISNPGVELAHAIACLVGPTGQIRVPDFTPAEIPGSVRRVLADVEVTSTEGGPRLEPHWGEPGLTLAEKVFGWCNLEVLAFECGDPKAPVNAIPPRAWARMQLRFVVGVDPDLFMPALRRHLDRHGFAHVRVALSRDEMFAATRIDPEHRYVRFAVESLTRTHGARPAILPNLGGSLPNDIFTDILGLVTIWVPHSYPACSQHAPNEHVPVSIVEEGLANMAGLYWDIGDGLPRD